MLLAQLLVNSLLAVSPGLCEHDPHGFHHLRVNHLQSSALLSAALRLTVLLTTKVLCLHTLMWLPTCLVGACASSNGLTCRCKC